MLEVRHVEKSFNGKVALARTSLSVAAGQSLALLGSSGSGKSTLLRIVVGLITPDRGSVVIGGTPVTAETLPALRLRMGYVIQEGGLFPHLTAGENVAIVARQLAWEERRIAERLEVLRTLVQIPADALDRYPGELSGGQRQRVALMRALMLDPDLVLLDEPLGALDPIVRAELGEELRRIFAETKKTVVIVTHDIAEAAHLAAEIALLREGRIVQKGTFSDLALRPADPFVTRFLAAHPKLPVPDEATPSIDNERST
jgi:osmoprotectant transport system ATP-binding protein